MGRELGEAKNRIKPRTQAWQDVFEAAQRASRSALSRYGDALARSDRLRDSTFATIASYAAEAGRAALHPYAERIGSDIAKQDKTEGARRDSERRRKARERERAERLRDEAGTRLWDDTIDRAVRQGRVRRKFTNVLGKTFRRITRIMAFALGLTALLLIIAALTADKPALAPFTTLFDAATDDENAGAALTSWGQDQYSDVREMFPKVYGTLTSWGQEYLEDASSGIDSDDRWQSINETAKTADELAEQSRNLIDWTIRPRVEGGTLELAGNIKENRRSDWTLCTDGTWGSFAIYRWPQSIVGYGTEAVEGIILEPPFSGEYYSGLAADEVVADLWDVDCTSFHLRAKVSSAWPSSFRVGIWAQHQRNPTEWGLLDDEKANVS